MNGQSMKDYYKSSDGNVHINLSLSREVSEIGVFSILKIFRLAQIVLSAFKLVCDSSTKQVYFSHTIRSAGFYRDVLILLILRFFGCSIVYHLHNTSKRLEIMPSIIFNGLYRGTKVVFLSNALIHSRFIGVAEIHVIPNFSEFGGISCLPRLELKRIIYVANLHTFKGYELLLDVCDELDKRGVCLEVNILGADGDLTTHDVNAHVLNYSYMRVKALGVVSREEMLNHYLSADIVMLLSRDEALPMCLIEGMSLGLPIISTDVGGVSELVSDNVNGYIVEPTMYEVVQKIELLCDNRSLLKRFSEGSFTKYNELFGREVYFNKFNEIFKI